MWRVIYIFGGNTMEKVYKFMVVGIREYDDFIDYFETLEDAQKCYDEMKIDKDRIGYFDQVSISVIICEK
jgi:hypothetical protein